LSLSAGECPGLLQLLFARERFGPQAPARYIIKMEEPGFPAIGKTNLRSCRTYFGTVHAWWCGCGLASRHQPCAL